MHRTVEFTAFEEALQDEGFDLPARTFIQDPQNLWDNLPEDLREHVLEALDVDAPDLDEVQVTVGRRPGGSNELENLLVRFSLDAEEPGEDELVADGTLEAAAPGGADAEADPPDVHDPADGDAIDEDPADTDLEDPVAADAIPEDHEVDDPAETEAVAEDPELHGPSEADADATDVLVVEEEEEEPEEEQDPLLRRRASAATILERIRGPRDEEEGEDEEPVGEGGLEVEEEEAGERPFVEIAPPADAAIEEVERYPVQEPFAFVRILYDQEEHEYWYEVIEPDLSEREANVLSFIEDTLVDIIEVGLSSMTEQEAQEMLEGQVDQIIYDYSITLSSRSKEKLLYFILRDFLGYAKLNAIMSDDAIEDVSCDGPNIPVFLYHRTYESLKSTVMWDSHDELDSFVIRLAQRSGKHISIADPLLDATLPDGSRLNATLGDEVTSKGSTFTIRKFKEDPFTPPDLIRYGTMNVEMLAYWWLAVQHGASAIYAGGTASGKTTSLNAILLFIPPQMKIVSIEDTREVNLPHLNWIPGKTRSGFGPRDASGHQTGEIDMFTLLKAALRQRPEYILVGEVRGEEAYALFQAMATGHTAYGTMHADSPSSVIHRLESDPISVPRSLLEALDIISIQIQTRIGEKRVRRTKQLVEVVGLDPHTREILTNDVFEWDPSTDEFEYSGVSYVLERIQMELNMSEAEMDTEMEQRKEIIRWMLQQDLEDLYEVGRVITMYYKDPDTLLERARADLAADPDAHTTITDGEEDAGDPWDLDDDPWDEDDDWGLDDEPPFGGEAEPEEPPSPFGDDEGDHGPDPVHDATDGVPGGPPQPAVADAGSGADEEAPTDPAEPDDGTPAPGALPALTRALRIDPEQARALEEAGYGTLAALEEADVEEIAELDGVTPELAERIKVALAGLEPHEPPAEHDVGHDGPNGPPDDGGGPA